MLNRINGPERIEASGQPTAQPLLTYGKVALFAAALLAGGCKADTDETSNYNNTLNVLSIDDYAPCATLEASVAPTDFDTIQIQAAFDLTDCDDPRIDGADWLVNENNQGSSTIELVDQTVTLANGTTLAFEGGGVVATHDYSLGVQAQNDNGVALGYQAGFVITEVPYRIDTDGYTQAVALGEVSLFCEANAGESTPTCTAEVVSEQ